jgi:hypothetical protein
MIARTTTIHPLPGPQRGPNAVSRWFRDDSRMDAVRLALLLAVHLGLGLLLSRAPALADAHVAVVTLLGFWYALSKPQLERAAYVGAYITGAEILWRMTGAGVFWEFGKYAIVAVFLLAMLRTGRLRAPIPPILFLL